MIQIQLSGSAQQALSNALDQVKRRHALMADVGRRVVNELRKHFQELNAENPNKLGGTRTNFWNSIRNSVLDTQATDDTATITIAHPAILQKLFGGTIHADQKLLAIPAVPQAYGRSPRLFTDLKFTILGKSKALMQGKTVFYWLKESVTQAAFPNTLPQSSEFSAWIEDTATKNLNRALGGVA